MEPQIDLNTVNGEIGQILKKLDFGYKKLNDFDNCIKKDISNQRNNIDSFITGNNRTSKSKSELYGNKQLLKQIYGKMNISIVNSTNFSYSEVDSVMKTSVALLEKAKTEINAQIQLEQVQKEIEEKEKAKKEKLREEQEKSDSKDVEVEEKSKSDSKDVKVEEKSKGNAKDVEGADRESTDKSSQPENREDKV